MARGIDNMSASILAFIAVGGVLGGLVVLALYVDPFKVAPKAVEPAYNVQMEAGPDDSPEKPAAKELSDDLEKKN